MMAACAVLLFLTAPRAWMAATGTAIMAVVGGLAMVASRTAAT